MTDQADSLLDPAEAIADAAVALVAVTDEGLKGLAAVFSGVEQIRGRDGDPGPAGPPGLAGASVTGSPGPPGLDGSPGPRPVRSDVERNARGMIDRVEQRMDDGSRRVQVVERDAAGRLLALAVQR